MEILITSYHYMANGHYSGIYTFPQHKDQDPIHMPPNTTLIKPPVVLDTQTAVWDGAKWSIIEGNQLAQPTL